jgi:hypothetical protein
VRENCVTYFFTRHKNEVFTDNCPTISGAFFEQDCLMVREEGSSRWEFFFDGVKGFDFEPGFIYTLEVRLEDRGTEVCLR